MMFKKLPTYFLFIFLGKTSTIYDRIKVNSLIWSLYLLISFVFAGQVFASEKSDSLVYSLNMRSVLGFGKYAPFLTSANEFDRHSIYSNNVSLWGTLHKPFDHTKKFDYGFGAELDANISGPEKRLFPGELYIEAKTWFMVLTAGMKKETYGNSDPLLSSGGMIWSRNSRPFPRISIESDGWLKVPYTFGLVEVHGGMTHSKFIDKTVTTNTLLHYKYAGFRIGGDLPVNINYTLQHAAQWAGTSQTYGTTAPSFSNFLRILMAKSGGEDAFIDEQINTLGNHMISKNVGLEIKLRKSSLELYWQNFYEDLPISQMYKSFNIEDGLWGLSLKMPDFKPLNRIAVEYLSTTDMSGPWHDLDGVIYGGQDCYYFNGFYPNGWSFYGMTIGNPWLTSPKYNEDGSVEVKNNRLRLYYVAGMGRIGDISYKATIALSKYYGTSWIIYDKSKDQFSWLLQADAPFPLLRNTKVSLGLSADNGSVYGDNFAILFGLSWNGIFKY